VNLRAKFFEPGILIYRPNNSVTERPAYAWRRKSIAEPGLGQPLGERMEHFILYSCDYCLTRWQAATLFDYGVMAVMIITGGWLTSRLQSR
jgi:hypothetical protein